MGDIIICVVTEIGLMKYHDFKTYEDALLSAFYQMTVESARCWRMYNASWFEDIPRTLDTIRELKPIAQSPEWSIIRGDDKEY